jgi:hypothetical protein
MLVNLHTADELFNSPHAPYQNPDKMELTTGLYKYPLACIQGLGQIQACQPLPLFSPIVNAINEAIAIPFEANDPVAGDNFQHHSHAIFLTSFQAYNHSIHNIAPWANKYKIKVGMVTAAMAGEFAWVSSDKTKATNAHDAIKPPWS